ncbi:MAG: hypothetical protein IV085_12795 [Thiobacillus sp.]|nr:hypothetical protein [Thiobacillus sp.]
MSGQDLILHGRDLAEAFARYEPRQSFNLVVVAALLLAGVAATKAYTFASRLQASEGCSEIRTPVSDWKVARSGARSQDVAMATKQNRLALKRRLDMSNGRCDDVTLALIYPKSRVRGSRPFMAAPGNPS